MHRSRGAKGGCTAGGGHAICGCVLGKGRDRGQQAAPWLMFHHQGVSWFGDRCRQHCSRDLMPLMPRNGIIYTSWRAVIGRLGGRGHPCSGCVPGWGWARAMVANKKTPRKNDRGGGNRSIGCLGLVLHVAIRFEATYSWLCCVWEYRRCTRAFLLSRAAAARAASMLGG